MCNVFGHKRENGAPKRLNPHPRQGGAAVCGVQQRVYWPENGHSRLTAPMPAPDGQTGWTSLATNPKQQGLLAAPGATSPPLRKVEAAGCVAQR